MQEDWDNLIILDACRYDMFQKLNYLKGKLEHRLSRGSCTHEFLKENFEGKSYKDTVYVTSNPLVNYRDESFAAVASAWKDGWNEELGTVLPETTAQYADQANESYQDKRLIVHFVQPHIPFIGERSRWIMEHDSNREVDNLLSRARHSALGDKETIRNPVVIWFWVKNGEIDKKSVWDAYEENLEIALKHVEKLLKNLKGKTVITADHGNLFGERLLPFPVKAYGHPCGIYKKQLIKVPWLIIENGERKTINTSSEAGNEEQIEDSERETIKQRLQELGYLE